MNHKKISLTLVISAIVLIATATACGRTWVYGTVTDKQYSPAYTSYTTRCTTTGTKKKETTICVPVSDYHPAYYTLVVHDCTVNDKCEEVRWNVSQETYNNKKVGDHFEAGQTPVPPTPAER